MQRFRTLGIGSLVDRRRVLADVHDRDVVGIKAPPAGQAIEQPDSGATWL
jgi:hypothetical protein